MTGKEAGHTDQHPPHIQNPDALEVAPGTAHENLEGWIPQLATEDEIRDALEKAFDYRGDITITRKDGTKIEGYLFDRRTGKTLGDSKFACIPRTPTKKFPSRTPNRRTGFLWPRHRRRQVLGSLDEEVRREKGRWRKRPEPLLRTSRLDTSFRSVILSGVEVLALR